MFMTWDESELGDFPIGMIALGKTVKTGFVEQHALTHSSTLRTLEEIFGLPPPYLGDAAKATDLAEMFTTKP